MAYEGFSDIKKQGRVSFFFLLYKMIALRPFQQKYDAYLRDMAYNFQHTITRFSSFVLLGTFFCLSPACWLWCPEMHPIEKQDKYLSNFLGFIQS